MKLKNIFLLTFIFIKISAFAQEFITETEATGEKLRTQFWDRTYFGGEFGLMFGSYTFVNISPEMGYMFTKNFSAGGGTIYQYYQNNTSYYQLSTSIYGGKAFAKYFVWRDLFLTSILEVVSLETRYYDYANRYPDTQNRFWFATPMVGIGYMQRFNGKSGIGVSILFNLNNDINSPYYGQASPMIRIGFSI